MMSIGSARVLVCVVSKNYHQGWHNKSSLLVKSKDQILAGTGPGNPIKVPHGATKSQVKRKAKKRHSEQLARNQHQGCKASVGRKGKGYYHLTDHVPSIDAGPSKQARLMWHRNKKRVGKKS